MRRLEITDLSFCETEFESCGKVQGGTLLKSTNFSFLSFAPFPERFFPPILESDIEVLEELEGQNAEKVQFLFDGNSSGVASITDSGTSFALVGNMGDSKFARASAMSY
jgi:hypothetical protein